MGFGDETLSTEVCWDFATESEAADLPNIIAIDLRFPLFVEEDIELRLDLVNFEGELLPSPLTGVVEHTVVVELAVVEESIDLVLAASRLLGDEDLDTAGEFQDRRAKLIIESDTDRVKPGACRGPSTACCWDDRLSSIVTASCGNEEMVIRGASVTGSGVTLRFSELRLLQSSLARPDGATLSLFCSSDQ